MTALTRIQASSQIFSPHICSDTDTVQNLLTQACQTPDLEEKQRIFNEAYQIIRAHAPRRSALLEPALKKLFFELLHAYATQTCYAQEGKEKDDQGNSLDEEEGFRKCARLCEFSLYLQLKSLKLTTHPHHSWNLYETLDELIASLGAQKEQQGMYFDCIANLNIDLDVLIQKTSQQSIREIFAQTLTRVSYCYQNIETLATVKNLKLHICLNEHTVRLIGSETLSQKQALVDFLYNRAAFTSSLQYPNEYQAKLKSYEPVKTLIAQSYSEDDPKRKSLLAQIANMQGLIIVRSKKEDALIEAEPYFQEAFNIRKTLIDQFINDQDRWSQKGLLCNIRTSLIASNLDRKWRTSTNIAAAKAHAQELQHFLKEAEQRKDAHCYYAGYKPFIQKAEKASLTLKERISEFASYWFRECTTISCLI